jgi:hypothetical protein
MKREVEKKERVGNKKRQQLISSEAMELGENIHVFWLESQYIYIYRTRSDASKGNFVSFGFDPSMSKKKLNRRHQVACEIIILPLIIPILQF